MKCTLILFCFILVICVSSGFAPRDSASTRLLKPVRPPWRRNKIPEPIQDGEVETSQVDAKNLKKPVRPPWKQVHNKKPQMNESTSTQKSPVNVDSNDGSPWGYFDDKPKTTKKPTTTQKPPVIVDSEEHPSWGYFDDKPQTTETPTGRQKPLLNDDTNERPSWGYFDDTPQITEKPTSTQKPPVNVDTNDGPSWGSFDANSKTTKSPAMFSTQKWVENFDSEGHPSWGHYVVNSTKSPARSNTQKWFVNFDSEGHPSWGPYDNKSQTTKNPSQTPSVDNYDKGQIWGFVNDNDDDANDSKPDGNKSQTTKNPSQTPSVDNYDKGQIWGFVNDNDDDANDSKPDGNRNEDTNVSNNNSKIDDDYNPCDHPPVMPDFSVSGDRIAVQKCNEYKWNAFNEREEQRKYEEDCARYKREHNITGPSIVGGQETKEGEFPHMVALGYKANPRISDHDWLFWCGGTLISERFVLTAAHCLYCYDDRVLFPEPKVVRMGEKNIAKENHEYSDKHIIDMIPHEDYNKNNTKINDIALLKLKETVLFEKHLHPACLWNRFNIHYNEVTTTGWGLTKERIMDSKSDKLLFARLDIIDRQTCDNILGSLKTDQIDEYTQICAGKLAGGSDACQGDSGGPLQVKTMSNKEGYMYHIIGVTSFGFGCGAEDTPGVYTRVSSYIDWIEKHVWNDKNW